MAKTKNDFFFSEELKNELTKDCKSTNTILSEHAVLTPQGWHEFNLKTLAGVYEHRKAPRNAQLFYTGEESLTQTRKIDLTKVGTAKGGMVYTDEKEQRKFFQGEKEVTEEEAQKLFHEYLKNHKDETILNNEQMKSQNKPAFNMELGLT